MTAANHLTMIVGTDRHGAIGKDNTLPWRHRGDMAHFKATTTNHIVIMGNNTFQSMGGKALKNRHNIVISSKGYDQLVRFENPPTYVTADTTSLLAARSPTHALERALVVQDLVQMSIGHKPEIIVIGGASIYEAFLPWTDKIIQSRLYLDVVEPDTFFPFHWLDANGWEREVEEFEPALKDPDDVGYEVITHRRKIEVAG